MCVCVSKHLCLIRRLLPASEEEMLYCLSRLFICTLICRCYYDSVEIRIQSYYTCFKLSKDTGFLLYQFVVKLSRIFTQQCCVNSFRMFSDIFQQALTNAQFRLCHVKGCRLHFRSLYLWSSVLLSSLSRLLLGELQEFIFFA